MDKATLIAQDLDKQIMAAHKHFQEAIAARLPHMRLESKERYFAVLSLLVAGLLDQEKPLREVLQDLMIAAAPHIAQELGEQ
jgi:hypothetical protein